MAASGTRRAEELLRTARSLSYQEGYSLTEGWNDNVGVDILNLGLDRLYAAITQIENDAAVQQLTIDVVAGTSAYDLPIEVHMALRVVDVRYYPYGANNIEFIPLVQGTIQDRFNYPTNIPDTYCIRDGQILLSPTPANSQTTALVINYQKRMRKIDIRRGVVQSRTTAPVTFTLTFPSTSQKDANMQQNADSLLDLIDYCCLVDRDGTAIVDAIPLNSYNTSTQVLTADPTYTIPAANLAVLDAYIAASKPVYVVQGDFTSTHSQLDRQCEDHLIEYTVLRFLRLSSDAEPTPIQMAVEEEVLKRLINQYRRIRPSVYPVLWQRMGSRSWPFGPRGMV